MNTTEAVVFQTPQPAEQAPSIRAWWKRPRILDVDAAPDSEEVHLDAAHSGRTRMAVAARWKGRTVGSAILDVQDHVAVLRRLHVDAAWRGRNVGHRLLQRLVQRARLHLIHDVYVLATAADAGFYAVHRFRPVETRASLRTSSSALVTSSLFKPAGNEDASYVLMGRHLTTGLVNAPSQGITVKL